MTADGAGSSDAGGSERPAALPCDGAGGGCRPRAGDGQAVSTCSLLVEVSVSQLSSRVSARDGRLTAVASRWAAAGGAMAAM